MTQVFLSYCREDIVEVSRLREDLIAHGIDAWWDKNLLPGQDWKHEIREAMKRSSAVILCLSAKGLARSRSYIYPEVLEAIAAYRQRRLGEIFIIPVRLSRCEIPSIEIDDTRTLDRLQVVDLFPANRWDRGIRKIVKSIGQISPGLPSSAEQLDLPTPFHQPPKPHRVSRASSQSGEACHDVFLSFSSKDAAIGSEMCDALEQYGVRCWMAPRDIVPGKRYTEQIIDAIVSSRAFVLIVSSNSNSSQHVIREVEKAVRQKITIIPFRIEDIPPTKDMDYLISISQWIDALTPPLSDHYTLLAQTLQDVLHQRSEPIPFDTHPHRQGKSPAVLLGVSLTLATIALFCVAGMLWFGSPGSSAQQGPAEAHKVASASNEPKTSTDKPTTSTDKPKTLTDTATSSAAQKALETSLQKKIAPESSIKQEARSVASKESAALVSSSAPAKPVPGTQPGGPSPAPAPAKAELSKDAIALEHLGQGNKLLVSRKLEDALPELLLAIQMLRSINDEHGELVHAYQLLGDLHSQEGDYPKAIKAYSEAIQRKETGTLLHARGLAHHHLGDRRKALADFAQATLREDGKNRAEFHLDKAILLALGKNFDAADLAYERAAQLDAQNPQVFYNWGLSCAMAGNQDRAIEKLREAIKLASRPEFFIERGRAYIHKGDRDPVFGEYRKAIEDFTEAMQLGRKDAEVYVLRGDALRLNFEDRVAILDYTEAISLVQKAAKSRPGEALKKRAYLGRGHCYLRQGYTVEALRDANFAKGLDPLDPEPDELIRKANQAAAGR